MSSFGILNNDCPECLEEFGPPPDFILSIPPPPIPYFVHLDPSNETSSCHSQCVWAFQSTGVEFVELPRHGHSSDDTWLLILGASCIGVLLLGGLLAFILLKCRSKLANKNSIQLASTIVKAKGCESVLYPYPAAPPPDGRILWATLTPRGTTHHYTTSPHPHITIPSYSSPCKPTLPPPDPPISFDNTGFVDSDSQTPLMESYQLSELVESDAVSNSSTLKKSPRPRVSSPTRIEHPNLPPLNLHPHRSMRRATMQRRESADIPFPSPIL
ncbi:UNVERIFIED_CONTAM: hypothetical protein PYX00_003294 [Menopon gallinae]|uniref:Uncharacterized protein n=1 Tax=Menopon gallinae TaxID=328185 RepID=A0AAW2I0U0_9NEOP